MNKIPAWVVVEAYPHPDYKIDLVFSSGEKKVFDASVLLEEFQFEKLYDPDFFLKAKAVYGTVVWDEDTDIAPEYLYENSVIVC